MILALLKVFLFFLGTCFDWQKVFLTAIPPPQLHKTVGVLAQSMWEGQCKVWTQCQLDTKYRSVQFTHLSTQASSHRPPHTHTRTHTHTHTHTHTPAFSLYTVWCKAQFSIQLTAQASSSCVPSHNKHSPHHTTNSFWQAINKLSNIQQTHTHTHTPNRFWQDLGSNKQLGGLSPPNCLHKQASFFLLSSLTQYTLSPPGCVGVQDESLVESGCCVGTIVAECRWTDWKPCSPLASFPGHFAVHQPHSRATLQSTSPIPGPLCSSLASLEEAYKFQQCTFMYSSIATFTVRTDLYQNNRHIHPKMSYM